MPDLEDRIRLLDDLSRHVEQLIVLDEVAQGADLSLLCYFDRVRFRGLTGVDAVHSWRTQYLSELSGFFEHHRRSDQYSAVQVAELIELAEILLRAVGLRASNERN